MHASCETSKGLIFRKKYTDKTCTLVLRMHLDRRFDCVTIESCTVCVRKERVVDGVEWLKVCRAGCSI